MAKCWAEVVRAAGEKVDVRGFAGKRAGRGQHLRRGVNRYHLAGERREAAGERARATTKIEHAVLGAKAGDLGDTADQRRGVGHTAVFVMRGGGAVPVRVERRCGNRGHQCSARDVPGHFVPVGKWGV